MRVCILVHSFLDGTGVDYEIGGVQTYCKALTEVLLEKGFSIYIIQLAEVDFRVVLEKDLVVYGRTGGYRKAKKFYLAKSKKTLYDLVIFVDYRMANWKSKAKAMAIQHGIEFDGYFNSHRGLSKLLYKPHIRFDNILYKLTTTNKLNKLDKLVCVDLNFINWVRASFPFKRWDAKMVYVPNFAPPFSRSKVEEKLHRIQHKPPKKIRIIIPRRFVRHRGTLMFSNVAKILIKQFSNLEFHFIGSGPEEGLLRQNIKGLDNIFIKRMEHDGIMNEFYASHITVIPTLWSEGTSLSCIEAMASASAVLATNVGGLGNLVIPGYNGLIVPPTEEQLKEALIELIQNYRLRYKLCKNAYDIALESFHKEKWKRRISAIISNVTKS